MNQHATCCSHDEVVLVNHPGDFFAVQVSRNSPLSRATECHALVRSRCPPQGITSQALFAALSHFQQCLHLPIFFESDRKAHFQLVILPAQSSLLQVLPSSCSLCTRHSTSRMVRPFAQLCCVHAHSLTWTSAFSIAPQSGNQGTVCPYFKYALHKQLPQKSPFLTLRRASASQYLTLCTFFGVR